MLFSREELQSLEKKSNTKAEKCFLNPSLFMMSILSIFFHNVLSPKQNVSGFALVCICSVVHFHHFYLKFFSTKSRIHCSKYGQSKNALVFLNLNFFQTKFAKKIVLIFFMEKVSQECFFKARGGTIDNQLVIKKNQKRSILYGVNSFCAYTAVLLKVLRLVFTSSVEWSNLSFFC